MATTMMMMISVREERPLEGAEVDVGEDVAEEVAEVAEIEVDVAEVDAGEDVEVDGGGAISVSTTPATD